MIDTTALRTLCEQQPVARVASVDLSQLLDENAALRERVVDAEKKAAERAQAADEFEMELERVVKERDRAESRLAALKEASGPCPDCVYCGVHRQRGDTAV